MTKIRLTLLGCLTLLIGWYVNLALPASAAPDPPPGYYASPDAPLPADPPAQPAVVHDHIALGSYVLIVGLTAVGTLIVVALAVRLRRPPVRGAEPPGKRDREGTIMPLGMDIHEIYPAQEGL